MLNIHVETNLINDSFVQMELKLGFEEDYVIFKNFTSEDSKELKVDVDFTKSKKKYLLRRL